MSAILGWVIFGVIVGALAKLLAGRSWRANLLPSIAGAAIGGIAGRLLGTDASTNVLTFRTYAAAIAGAVILLLLYRLMVRPRRATVHPFDRDHAA